MLTDLLRTLPESPFLAHPANPFPFHLSEGAGKVVVIVGENASGKSVMFQAIARALRAQEVTGITISIRERTGGQDGGVRRAMMFGNEADQSTGHVSFSVITRGMHNARSYAERGQRNVLMLDEPEMGLSDGYAGALGEYLAGEARTLPEGAEGLVVVTHSRALVRRLSEALPERPHLVVMGPSPLSLEQWWSTPEHRSVQDLVALQERGRDGRRRVQQVLNALQEAASLTASGKSPSSTSRRRP